jgi:uncharacterized protein YbgA (DUF1722 family)/uncharacterized protein YbbK (DUF523 family)
MNRPHLNEEQEIQPIRIGISACLLGQKVRFDGGHKHDRYLTDTLGQYFEWVPVCPEVEVGLGVPRPTLRLETRNDELRLIMPKEGRDLTRTMTAYARVRVKALEMEGLTGYLLKSASPSCGLERVKVYSGDRHPPTRKGRGLFAQALVGRLSNLPVEEEGRLHDPRLRENWITRVFAYHRLRGLWRRRWGIGDLVRFHTAQKFLLLAHSPKDFRELGRVVAQAKDFGRAALRTTYESQFMSALSKMATRAKNTNVLQHILGFFKRDLDAASRQELLNHIQDYRRGLVPLVVPLTLVAHHVRLLDVAYLRDQVYLHPHPKELALRNHV